MNKKEILDWIKEMIFDPARFINDQDEKEKEFYEMLNEYKRPYRKLSKIEHKSIKEIITKIDQ